MKVAVLGCGPAGLMAALAVEEAGHSPRIYSRKEKSVIGGAQYLHKPLPLLHGGAGPEGLITVKKIGTAEGYAQKVYGDPTRATSWSDYQVGEQVPAWDLRSAYDGLWDLYESRVQDQAVDPAFVRHLLREGHVIISSVPAPALCFATHEFARQSVYIDLDASAFPDNTIVYNGSHDVPWSRGSRIFGVTGGLEYRRRPRVKHATARKPLSTDCTCFPAVLRVGRYGAWDKSLLTHHAFEATLEAFL